MQDLGTFNVSVNLQDDSKYDIYLSHDGDSGEHYSDLSLNEVGELVMGLIDCIRESY